MLHNEEKVDYKNEYKMFEVLFNYAMVFEVALER